MALNSECKVGYDRRFYHKVSLKMQLYCILLSNIL